MLAYQRRKTDANQAPIVKAFQRAGWHVSDLSGCGNGIPDLLITKNHIAYLIEIKNKEGRNRFTPAQLDYYAAVKCLVYVVRSINDVESFIKGQLRAINGRNTQEVTG